MEYHVPVLLRESIDGLDIKPDGVYVDVTYGGGGHSAEILKKITTGKLIAFDQDSEARANKTDDERLIFIPHNFRYLANFLRYLEIPQVDGVLADLGVSSHHFESPHRGFSFRWDSALDMRMNQHVQRTAAEVVNTSDVHALTRILREYGELDNAWKLAHQIVQARDASPLETTQQLRDSIKHFVPAKREHKYLAQVFQALRMEVNDEIGALDDLLQQCSRVIKPEGRLVVITYHSLEDRAVKNFIKAGNVSGTTNPDIYGNIHAPFQAVNRKIITASDDELEQNNRSRSAKLRIAERTEENA